MAWFDLDEETAETTTTEKAIPLNRLVARSTDEKAIPLTKLRSVGEFINAPPPRTMGEEFSVGLDRGEDQLRGLGYGLVGLAADALGVKAGADWGYDNYRQAMEEAASKEATVTDPFTEIGSFSDAGRYAVGLIGEQIPQLITSIAGGGVGGFVGKSLAKKMVANEVLKRVAAGATATAAEREIAEEATKSILRKAAMAKAAEEGGEAGLGRALGATLGTSQPGAAGFTTVASSVPISAGAAAGQAARGVLNQGFRYGAYTGAYLANFGQIAGGTYGQIRDETGEGGPGAVVSAVGTAVPGAALDTLSEIFIASRPIQSLRPFARGVESKALGLSLPARVGVGAAKGIGVGAPLEGATEYLQTGLEQAAVGMADPNQTVGERLTAPGAERERRIAGAAGATVGGILGGGAGTLEFLAPRTKAKLDEIGATPPDETSATTLEERLRAAWPTLSEDQKLQALQKLREKADELQGFQGATSDGPRLIAGNWTDEVDVDGLKLRYNADANIWAALNPPEIEGLGPAVATELSNARVALINLRTRKGAALAARAQDALSALRGETEPGQTLPPAAEAAADDGTELVPVETMMARPPGRQGVGGARTPTFAEAARPGATIEFNGRRGVVTSSRTNLPGKDSTLPGRSIFLTADFGDGPADIPIGQVQNVRVISEQQLAQEAKTEAEIERLQNELDDENITEEDRRNRAEILSNLRASLLSPTASGIAFQDGPAGFTVGATEPIAEFNRRRIEGRGTRQGGLPEEVERDPEMERQRRQRVAYLGEPFGSEVIRQDPAVVTSGEENYQRYVDEDIRRLESEIDSEQAKIVERTNKGSAAVKEYAKLKNDLQQAPANEKEKLTARINELLKNPEVELYQVDNQRSESVIVSKQTAIANRRALPPEKSSFFTDRRKRDEEIAQSFDGSAVGGMRTGDKASILLGDEMVPARFVARNANGNARFQLEDGSRIELTPEQFKNVGFRIENPAELSDEADFNRQLREAKTPEELARVTGGFLPAGGTHKVKVKTPGGDSDLTYRVRYYFQTSKKTKPRLTGEPEAEAETIPGYFATAAKLGGPTTEEGQAAVASELTRGLAEGVAAAEGTAVGGPQAGQAQIGGVPYQFIGGDQDTFNEIWGYGPQGSLVMKRPLYAKFELLVEPTPAKPDFDEAYARAFQDEQAKVLAGDFYTGPQGEAVPVRKSERQIQKEMELARERAAERARKEVAGKQDNFNTSMNRLKKDMLRSMDTGHVVTITPETVQEKEGRVGAEELLNILKADPDVNIDDRVPLDPTGKPTGQAAVPTVVSIVWRGLDGRQSPYTFTQGSKPVSGGRAQDPTDLEAVASGSPMTPQERVAERKLQAKEREAEGTLAVRQEAKRRQLRDEIERERGGLNKLQERANQVAAKREERQALEQEINELRGAIAATEAPAPTSQTEAIAARLKELNEENDKAARSDMRLRKQLRENEEEVAKKRAATGKDTNSVAYRSRMSGDLSRLMDQRNALEGRLRESKNARNRRNAEIRRLNEQAKAVSAQEKQEAANRRAAAQRERRRLRAALAEREKTLSNFVVDEKPIQELQKAQEKVAQLESRIEPLEAELARERLEFEGSLKAYNPARFTELRGPGSFAKVYQTDPKRAVSSELQRLDDRIEESERIVQMRDELKNLPEPQRILIEEILGKAATVFPGETNQNRLLAEAQRGSRLDVNESQQIIDVAQTLAFNSAVANFLRIVQARRQQGGAPSQIEEAEQTRLTQAFISALNEVVRGRTNPREVAASVLRLAKQARRSPSEERIAAQIEAATLGVAADDIQEIFDADTEQALNKLEELRRKPTRDVTTKSGQRGQVDPKQLRGLWDRLYQIIENKTASLTSDTPGSRARARAARSAGMVKKQDLAAAKKKVLEAEKQGAASDTAVKELTAQLQQLPKPDSISDTDPQVDQKRADLRQRRVDLNNALIAARNSAQRQRARQDDKNRAERVGRLLDEVVAVMEEFYKTYNPLNAATQAVDAARKRAETARPNQLITQSGTDPNIVQALQSKMNALQAQIAEAQDQTQIEDLEAQIEDLEMQMDDAQDLQIQLDAVKTDPTAKFLGSGSGTTPQIVLAREAMDYLRNKIPPREAAIVYKVSGLAYSVERRRRWYGDENGARLKQFEEALAQLDELEDVYFADAEQEAPITISEEDKAIAEKHFAYIRDIPNLPPRQEPTNETETILLRTTPTREKGILDRGTSPGLRGSGQPERGANNRLRFAVAPSPVSGTGLDPRSYGDSELPRPDAVSESLGGQLGFDAPGGLPSAGQPDAGRSGGVPRPADGATAGPRVQRNLSAAEIRRLAPQAERFYVEAFTEKDLSALPDEEIGRVYTAIQTEAKGAETTLAAGGNIIAQTPQPMADLLSSQNGFELLTGMAAEARQQQLNRERVANLRKNIGALAEARAFAGTTKFLETAANDTKLPAQLRLLAKELLRLNSRVEWNDNVATQIAAFGRNYIDNPITRKELEKRVKVETKDKRPVYVFKIGGQRQEVPVPTRKADALETQERIYEAVRQDIAMSKVVPWAGRAVNIRNEGAFSIYVNLNAVHDRPGGSVATLVHEYEHVVLGAKLDGEINLNPVETAALERLENMRRAAVTAAAKERGIAGEFDAVNAQLVEISGQEANQTLRALTNLQEFVIEATGNPAVFKLLSDLGFAKGDGAQAQFTGALRDLWTSVAELEAGVKMAPDSPLARAFVDSYMLTYASLGNPDKEYNVGFGGPTAQFTAPQIIKNALVDELDAALLQERFIRDQLEARNLAGTSADRNALAQEFSARRAEVAKQEAAREAELARGRTPTRAPRANLPDFKPTPAPKTTTETKVETPTETKRSVMEILTGRKADEPMQTDKEADAEQTNRDDALARMALAVTEQEFVGAFNAARQNGVELPDVDPVTLYYVTRANAARQLGLTQLTSPNAEEQANLAISQNVEREISDLIAQLPDPNEPVFGQPTAERRAADARRTELGEALRAVQIQGVRRRQPRRDFLFTVQEYEELIAQNEARGNTEAAKGLRAELEERKKSDAAVAAAEKAAAKRAETARKKAEREQAKAQAKIDDEKGAKTAQRFGLTPKPKAEPKAKTETPKAKIKEEPKPTDAEIEADFNAAVASLEWGPWRQIQTGDGPKWVREAKVDKDNTALWKNWKTGNKENFLARGLRTDKPKGAKIWNAQQFSTPSGVPDTDAAIPPDERPEAVSGLPVDDDTDADYLEEADPTSKFSLGGNLIRTSAVSDKDRAKWKKMADAVDQEVETNSSRMWESWEETEPGIEQEIREASLEQSDAVSAWFDEYRRVAKTFGVSFDTYSEFVGLTAQTEAPKDPRFQSALAKINKDFPDDTPEERFRRAYLSIGSLNPRVNELNALVGAESWFTFGGRSVGGWSPNNTDRGNYENHEPGDKTQALLAFNQLKNWLTPALDSEQEFIRNEAKKVLYLYGNMFGGGGAWIMNYEATLFADATRGSVSESLGGTLARLFRDQVIETPTGGTFVLPKLISAVAPTSDRRITDLDQQKRGAMEAEASRATKLLRDLRGLMRQAARDGVQIKPQVITTAIGSLENPLTPEQREDVRVARLTDPEAASVLEDSYRRENKEAYREKQKAARASLPKEMRSVVVQMSDHIAALSKLLKEVGLLTDDLILEIDANLGMYLTRVYRAFTDPEWEEKVRKMPEVMSNARRVVRQRLVDGKAEAMRDEEAEKGRVLSREEARRMANSSVTAAQVEDEISRMLADAKPVAKKILSGRIMGQKDLGILKQRGNIEPEIQALLGVYDDPETSYGKTILKVSSLIYNQMFLNDLKKLGLSEGWFYEAPKIMQIGDEYIVTKNGVELFRSDNFDDAREYQNTLPEDDIPPGFIKIASQGNEKLAPMDGVYGMPEVVAGLYEMFPLVDQQLPAALNLMGKATGFTMAMATVASAQGQSRNYQSGWLKYISTGNIFGGTGPIKKAHKLAWVDFSNRYPDDAKGRAKLREEIEDAVRRGVFGESVSVNMINDLVSSYSKLGSAAKQSDTEWEKRYDAFIRQPVKRTWDFAQGLYTMSDNIFRGMVYFAEIDNYRKIYPKMSEEALKDKAAKISRDIYWTYSQAPKWVQDLKRGPGLVIAPFITFTTEVVRTLINTGRLAFDEFTEGRRTGNTGLTKLAMRRVAGMSIAMFAPGIVGGTLMSLAGFSAEDEEDLRKFLPDWQKNNQLLLLGRNGNKISFIDVSFLDPHEYFKKPVKAFFRAVSGAEDPQQAIVQGAVAVGRELLDPFMSEQLFAGAVMDVARNIDSTGRRIYNPQDTADNIVEAVGRHVGNAFVPGTARSLYRVGMGATGTVTESGRSYDPVQEVSALVAGQRINQIDMVQSLGFKASEYNRNKRDATALFNRVALNSGEVNPGDVADAWTRANLAHMRLARGFREVYKSIRRLGLSDAAATERLRAMGVTREDIERAKAGIYEPFNPSGEARKDMRPERLRELEAAIRQAQTEQLD